MIFRCVKSWEHSDINSLHTFPPHRYTVANLPWEIQKSHFSTVSFIHRCTSDYFRYLGKKTNCYSLTHHTWKMSPHCLVKCTTFSFDWRHVAFLQTFLALKKPVVMCGKWNVRHATLQQMFKVTTFCTDTRVQSFSPLINCIVHHALLKFSPCRNKTLLQLVRIADWYSIRVKKWKS